MSVSPIWIDSQDDDLDFGSSVVVVSTDEEDDAPIVARKKRSTWSHPLPISQRTLILVGTLDTRYPRPPSLNFPKRRVFEFSIII